MGFRNVFSEMDVGGRTMLAAGVNLSPAVQISIHRKSHAEAQHTTKPNTAEAQKLRALAL